MSTDDKLSPTTLLERLSTVVQERVDMQYERRLDEAYSAVERSLIGTPLEGLADQVIMFMSSSIESNRSFSELDQFLRERIEANVIAKIVNPQVK